MISSVHMTLDDHRYEKLSKQVNQLIMSIYISQNHMYVMWRVPYCIFNPILWLSKYSVYAYDVSKGYIVAN